MTEYIGESAALATAIMWGFTSVFFTLAGRMVGSPVVNRTRLLLAVLMIGAVHWLMFGAPAPLDAEGYRWGWLALSGVIGLVIGDALLFQAFVMIGARLSMLMMSLAPVFSTLLGWLWLEEVLSGPEFLGIGLAVAGVVWVITDRAGNGGGEAEAPRDYLIGVLCALGGAVGQALGLVTSKLGLEGDFSPISGNMIRLLAATALIWAFTVATGAAQHNFRRLKDQPRAWRWLLLGTVAGPVVGVSLSLLAVQRAPVGIASTLMQLTPIFLLPVGYFAFKERVGVRAVLGTLLAVAGTALIFLN
ncbi:MAG: DMT family transporter [Anaerolineales bacterium]